MTGQEVFDIAINMMDEQNESTGATVTTDTKEYQLRTVRLLNSILPKLCARTGNEFTAVSQLTDNMPVDDSISSAIVAPYLAALLIQTDGDTEMSDRLKLQADESLAQMIGRLTQAESEPIKDVYGGVNPYNEFSSW